MASLVDWILVHMYDTHQGILGSTVGRALAGLAVSSHNSHQRPSSSGRPRHAGFWIRLAAVILDLVVLGIPLRVILLIPLIFGSDTGEVTGFDLSYTDAQGETVTKRISLSVADLAQLVLLAVITVLLWVNWDGCTPGKKMLRIRIVSYPDYQPFSYPTASIRTLASLLGLFTLGLGYVAQAVMIAARDDKRGYHDLIAGTCVIHD
jgi:uncharacterized RDD family membrane protein YckC